MKILYLYDIMIEKYQGGTGLMENTKNEQKFGRERINFLSYLEEIDNLPTELATELRGKIYSKEINRLSQTVRKNAEIDRLIELGYLADGTDEKNILETKYNRDNLFQELSKRTYDIQPNSTTTKKEMIDYILANDRALGNLVRKKWITIEYTEKTKCWAKELGKFLDIMITEHPYKTQDVLLVDFYNELKKDPYYRIDEKTATIKKVDLVTFEQENMPRDETTSKKNKKVALWLCILGGYIGLHDFYTGRIGKGILYLLTMGLFLIGWIIDIVKIANGTYTDSKGLKLK